MKKIFFIFIMIFGFISIANAQKCTVVTGDGSRIGDEIECGSEHFYILKSDDNETQLLAKYNLLVGDKIDNVEVDSNAPHVDDFSNEHDFGEAAQAYCDSYAIEKGYNTYYTVPMISDERVLKSCRFYEKIEYEHVVQSEKAVGTFLENGKSRLPLYGITYMNPEWGYDAIHDNIIHQNILDDNKELIVEGSSFEGYLKGYKEELERQKISVKSVDFPVRSKIVEFLETVSGKQFVFDYNYSNDPNDPYEYWTAKMDIKEYVPEKYSWLYDRTYWLGSGYIINPNYHLNADDYISNEGLLCALGRGECVALPYPIGNGLRPLVTIKTSDIEFKIETKTDGHGTVKAEKESAKEGEVIKITVIPDEGYTLGVIKVTDGNGKVVYFTDYSFTMPNTNVLIEATFVKEKENPETKDVAISLLFIVFILSTGIVLYNKKRLFNITSFY